MPYLSYESTCSCITSHISLARKIRKEWNPTLFKIFQETLVDETTILKGLIFCVILVLAKHRNYFVKMDCRYKEKLFPNPPVRWKKVAGTLSRDLQQCFWSQKLTMLPACLAAGRYGHWLEIIVFNNADHHKSSWEITLNITLGL